jgi:DNA-binding response OmpR family regulator
MQGSRSPTENYYDPCGDESKYGCDREYLRIFVRQLRLKIEDNPANPKYLLTEPRIGYRFVEAVEGDSVIPSRG